MNIKNQTGLYIKTILFSLGILVLSGCKNNDYDYIVNDDYINYKVDDIDIFIGDIENEFDGINISIIDGSNPGYKVYDSYKIDDIKVMNEVLNIIQDYNSKNPNSEWNRTKISMLLEWVIHNELYKKELYLNHTKDVDFNNDEITRIKNKIKNNF